MKRDKNEKREERKRRGKRVYVQSKRRDKMNAWICALAIGSVSFFFLRVPLSE